MILYDAAWAPSPRRVRIFLAEKGIDVPRELIDMRTNAQLGEAYLRVNPRGTLPALRLDDGTLIDESEAICRYFEALHPDPPLFGRTPKQIALVEAWARRVEQDGYQAVVAAFRNTAPIFADRGLSGAWPAMPQIPALAERGRAMWELFADALDARLAEQEWLAGGAFSFADIAALVAVDFARPAKLPPAIERPNVARWHAAASARPSAAA